MVKETYPKNTLPDGTEPATILALSTQPQYLQLSSDETFVSISPTSLSIRERKQSHKSGPLDRPHNFPLTLGTITAALTRKDLTAMGQQFL